MKLKLGIATILFSTAAIIGLIRLTLNKSASPSASPSTADEALIDRAPPAAKKRAHRSDQQDELRPNKGTVPAGLSQADTEAILKMASLDADSLDQELKTLADEVAKGEVIAKEKLARFAMLRLEAQRRQDLDEEPELKDPLFAHADNLLEIRRTLDDLDD